MSELNGHRPVYDIETEESLLGAMMTSISAIMAATVVGVKAEAFYKPAHGYVFAAVSALYALGEPADPVTVADELRRRGLLDAVGGPAVLVTLQARTPSTSSAGRYAAIVMAYAARRRMIVDADQLMTAAREGTDTDVIIARLSATAARGSAGEAREDAQDARWPIMAPEAAHGPIGDVVGLLAPITEADPVAVMVTLDAMCDVALGRGPRWDGPAGPLRCVGGAVLVGSSAGGAKGTSLSIARVVWAALGADQVETRQCGSGESLIDDLAERGGAGLVVETELSRLVARCTRESSTLDAVLRQADDGRTLSARSRSAGAVRCDEPHFSLLAHTTPTDAGEMPPRWRTNGVANRWRWHMVRRSRIIVEDRPLALSLADPAVAGLVRALRRGRDARRMAMSPDAQELWRVMAEPLATPDSGDPTLDAMMARGRPHVLRRALALAALDGATHIEIAHMRAGMARWDHAVASLMYLWGPGGLLAPLVAEAARPGSYEQRSLDERRLEEVLAEAHPGGLSRTRVKREVFSGNRSSAEVDERAGRLVKAGVIEAVSFPPPKGGGRPPKGWVFVPENERS